MSKMHELTMITTIIDEFFKYLNGVLGMDSMWLPRNVNQVRAGRFSATSKGNTVRRLLATLRVSIEGGNACAEMFLS